MCSFAFNKKRAFRKVVLLEYPRKGIKSLGFLTGEIQIIKKGKKTTRLSAIFLPSTPNPTTGYLLMLPEKDFEIVDISFENAARLIISGGVIGKELKIYDK